MEVKSCTTVTVSANGVVMKLSGDEARQLYHELEKLLGLDKKPSPLEEMYRTTPKWPPKPNEIWSPNTAYGPTIGPIAKL